MHNHQAFLISDFFVWEAISFYSISNILYLLPVEGRDSLYLDSLECEIYNIKKNVEMQVFNAQVLLLLMRALGKRRKWPSSLIFARIKKGHLLF